MKTRQIAPILALIAGFMTCIISFVQRVDMTVFAKRFIIVTIIFFVIGSIIGIVLDLNFKDFGKEEDSEAEEEPDEKTEAADGETVEKDAQ